MSKMGLHDPFGHVKHKLWPKERSGVKLAIWLLTTKSQESPRFPYFQVACNIPLKRSWRGLQLCFRLHLNRRFSRKVIGLQSCRNLSCENFGTFTWEFQDKWHLGVGLVAKKKMYNKGEGGGFPQVRAVVNFVSSCLPVARPCTKVLQLRTNQLVVWFVQVCVSKWSACKSS